MYKEKRVGRKIQPCLTPIFVSNVLVIPQYLDVLSGEIEKSR
jgi:hypothetical protein